jgi:hypothetical protein
VEKLTDDFGELVDNSVDKNRSDDIISNECDQKKVAPSEIPTDNFAYESKKEEEAIAFESVVVKEESKKVEEEEQTIKIDQDITEKDLQLEINTSGALIDDDMDSQLNPDAKEFVPFTSPPIMANNNHIDKIVDHDDDDNLRSPSNIIENGKSLFVNPMLNNFSDSVVSQSPRKAEAFVMEDVQVPEENDFDKEADARPHEISLLEENFQRIDSPEKVHLKETLQVDDKLEQEYKDDSQSFDEEVKQQIGEEYSNLESSFNQYSNGFQSKIDDPMNRSFYEGRDMDFLADPAKNILNTMQPLSDNELDTNQEVESQQNVIDLTSEANEQVDLISIQDNIAQEPQQEQQQEQKSNEIVTNVELSQSLPDAISPVPLEEKKEELVSSESQVIIDDNPTKVDNNAKIEEPKAIVEKAIVVESKKTEVKKKLSPSTTVTKKGPEVKPKTSITDIKKVEAKSKPTTKTTSVSSTANKSSTAPTKTLVGAAPRTVASATSAPRPKAPVPIKKPTTLPSSVASKDSTKPATANASRTSTIAAKRTVASAPAR